ncbi:MAG: T9SS type A sorting domain-containing protein [Bacteroidales bacterium]
MTTFGILCSLKKTRGLLILSFIGIFTTGIKAQQNYRNYFLVDTIYSENSNLLATYIYDNENKLIKKTVTDQVIGPDRTIYRTWTDSFIYQNNKVTKIMSFTGYIDSLYEYDQKSNFVKDSFEYNSEGNLIRSVGKEFIYENGYVVSTTGFYLDTCFYQDTIVYNDLMNVTKHISVYPETNMMGEPIIGTYRVITRTYEYDNSQKPNFGIDYLFAYNPFPYTESPKLIKGLSKNNMTNAEMDGYFWIYTYNKYGLPATIETKWIGTETANPMILRIKYKQIADVGVSEIIEEIPNINIYPNPTNDNFIIDYEFIGTIKLYNMIGKEVLSQEVNGKIEISINHLPQGVYNILLLSEGIIKKKNCRIVKL